MPKQQHERRKRKKKKKEPFSKRLSFYLVMRKEKKLSMSAIVGWGQRKE